jgi:hypothetical protein
MKKTETIRIAFDFEITYANKQGRTEALDMAMQCNRDATRYGRFGAAGVKIVRESAVVLTPHEK